MSTLARSIPAAAAPPPYRLHARPSPRLAVAAATALAAAATAGALAGAAWAAPWTGAGTGTAVVMAALGWAQARIAVTADDTGIRAVLPRTALGLPWPPLRRVALPWHDVRSVRLARRGTRVFGPAPDDGAVLPCDVATVSGDGGAILLRADLLGGAAIRLAERIAARRGLTVEPG